MLIILPHGRITLTGADESMNPSKPPTRAAGLTNRRLLGVDADARHIGAGGFDFDQLLFDVVGEPTGVLGHEAASSSILLRCCVITAHH